MAALIRAIEDHRIDLVRQLLDLGVDVNQVDEQGRTPLIVSIESLPEVFSFDNIVHLLLNRGADINQRGGHWNKTPLLACSYGGKTELARLLLDRGADVHQMDDDGVTPLIGALRSSRTDLALLLLERYEFNPLPTCAGVTPLHIASENGLTEVVRNLLDRGVDINWADDGGDTALCEASRSAQRDVVRLLLDRGADFRRANDYGDSPLTLARVYTGAEPVGTERRPRSDLTPEVSDLIIRHAASSEAWGKLLAVFFAVKLVVCLSRARKRAYAPGGDGARAAQASFERNVRQRV